MRRSGPFDKLSANGKEGVFELFGPSLFLPFGPSLFLPFGLSLSKPARTASVRSH